MRFFLAAILFSLGIVKPAQAIEMLVCTEMWCNEGLHVGLKSEKWAAGNYTFVVKSDDKTVTCVAKLPFDGCDDAVTCDAKEVMIGTSGCALPPDAHSFYEVMVLEPPSHVNLSIRRGDGKVFTFDSDVQKQCGFPNGEQCDIRECCSAQMTADVVWK